MMIQWIISSSIFIIGLIIIYMIVRKKSATINLSPITIKARRSLSHKESLVVIDYANQEYLILLGAEGQIRPIIKQSIAHENTP